MKKRSTWMKRTRVGLKLSNEKSRRNRDYAGSSLCRRGQDDERQPFPEAVVEDEPALVMRCLSVDIDAQPPEIG